MPDAGCRGLRPDVRIWIFVIPAGVPRVGQQREQEEEAAQQILPLGYPGDRFDMQGMQGQRGPRKGAPPHRAGQPPRKEKEQAGMTGMKHQVDQMVPTRDSAR